MGQAAQVVLLQDHEHLFRSPRRELGHPGIGESGSTVFVTARPRPHLAFAYAD
jgi:hypothetical protein